MRGRDEWRSPLKYNEASRMALGRFATVEEANRAAASLRELAKAHVHWLQTHPDFERSESCRVHATPPLLEFGNAHGFEWGEGLGWDQDDEPCAGSFSAHVLDSTVVVYRLGALDAGWDNCTEYFAAVGALAVGLCLNITVVISAKGEGPAVDRAEVYGQKLESYGRAVHFFPPWGRKVANDPRLAEHENDVDATDLKVQRLPDGIRLHVVFDDPFAGAITVQDWLKREGFRDVTVTLDTALSEVEPRPTVEPKTGLFGDLRPLDERVAEADEEQLARLAFDYGPEQVDGLDTIDGTRLAELWEPLGREVSFGLALERAAYTEDRAWLDRIWEDVVSSDDEGDDRYAGALRAVLGQDEAVRYMRGFVEAAPTPDLRTKRLWVCESLKDPCVLDWIHEFAPSGDLSKARWVAYTCGVGWDRIVRWCESGDFELAGWCICAMGTDKLPRDASALIRRTRRRATKPLRRELRYALRSIEPWWRFW